MADVFAGRTNIEAHEALATRAEHLAIVEGKVGLVDEEVEKGIVVKSQTAAVEPYQETGLRTDGVDSWNIVMTIFLDKTDVVLDISQHFLAPLLTMAEGRDGGDMGKDMRFVKLVGMKPAIEFLAQVRIGYDGMGRDDASDVESLRRSLHGDTDFRCLL